MYLNSEQSKLLANFFFDRAKGIVLGVLSFTISFSDISNIVRFTNALMGVFMVTDRIKLIER
jgi:hypothetical protein